MKKRPASVTSDHSLGKFTKNVALQREDGGKATISFLSPTTQTNRSQSKKMKTTDPLIEPLSESADQLQLDDLALLKTMFLNQTVFPVNYDQLVDFISNVGKTSEILHLTQQYTKNIRYFLEMLKTLYPSLINRSMKIKFTKIRSEY
ncbi:hypothetical protein Zmor_024004 [Zophobas morio]|uniref:Uncharacterized protein n=1 Tax=Zophobas morio TaxID=2755281 RepID=A0AA38M6Y2_9CUCU|nr:hypothetical protein Zmor_024004 [Zophobas morio]